ncbi:hypothetical protein GFV12_02730 [Desulfurobacterium thermolithotrophum]|uniref:hypothetical protein n=1 Tax=Desulfurobacterium thermolithotrophum TaxID=64160 RepID=UPI0013D5B86F|nr:hypothetical protein [Desulfurobacterium thermolithotrophum]
MKTKRKVLIYFAIGIFTLIYISFRISYYPFESDELQHLHVVYGWTQNLLQYKDVFDNHVPLFHILMAKLIEILQIKPSQNFVIYVRFIVFFLFFLPQLIIIYLLLKKGFKFSYLEIFWIICILTVIIPNSDIATRPAPLYTFLFLLAIYIISFFDLKKRKVAFFLGLVNGVNAMVSLKTVILFVPPQLITLFIIRKFYNEKINLLSFFFYFLLGFSIFPLFISIYFVKLHDFNDMFYYTVKYNLLPIKNNYLKRGLIFISIMAIYSYTIWKYKKTFRQTTFSFFSITLLSLAFLIIYPERQSQTTMPIRLLVYLWLLIILVYFFKKIRKENVKLLQISMFFILFMYKSLHPNLFIDHNEQYKKSLALLLSLAGKNDYVMDAKGESIFWKRPYYYGLEEFTSMRLKKGLLKDKIVPELVKHNTHLIFLFDGGARFPRKDLTFIKNNYLPADKWVLIAGKKINKKFKVTIPGNYIIINQNGKKVKGILNGNSYVGNKVFLSSGFYEFVPKLKEKSVYIYWYKAYKKGVLPNGISK